MATEYFQKILEHEIQVRNRNRFYLAGFSLAVLVVVTALIAI